jgi:hypothetical protein
MSMFRGEKMKEAAFFRPENRDKISFETIISM